MWIDVIQLLEGPPVESFLCGIGGWWRKLKCVGEFIIACSFRNVEDGFSWVFTSVYGPNPDCDRRY